MLLLVIRCNEYPEGFRLENKTKERKKEVKERKNIATKLHRIS